MIHYAPPHLTTTQMRNARRYPPIVAVRHIGQYLDPYTRDVCRNEARHIFRDTVGKCWQVGQERVAFASTIAAHHVSHAIGAWETLATDARGVYISLLVNQRCMRYCQLYGGPNVRKAMRRLLKLANKAHN